MSRWFASLVLASMLSLPAMAIAQEATPTPISPAFATSARYAVTLSMMDMTPGLEVWAIWIAMPEGVAVEVPGTDLGQAASLTVALSGSMQATGIDNPLCVDMEAGGQHVSREGATTRTVLAGNATGCAWGDPTAYRFENTDDALYTFAGLSLGTPWVPGMADYGTLYGEAGASIVGYQITPSQFAATEEVLRTTGAVTLTIAQITLAPNGRVITDDLYPAMRYVLSGRLSWGLSPEGTGVTPEREMTAHAGTWVGWVGVSLSESDTAGMDMVLTNHGDKPITFIEWSVTPGHTT